MTRATSARERCQQLRGRITAARPSSLAGAVLARSDTDDPETISVLADLLAKQSGFDNAAKPLLPDGDLRRALVSALQRWVDALVASVKSRRYQLAYVGQALSRFGVPDSIPLLSRLLDEDLTRRRRALEAVRAAQDRGSVIDRSEAQSLYVWQYRQSFINFGGKAAAVAAIPYLDDPDFGFEAANVLKSLYDGRQGEQKEEPVGGGIDYSEVPQRRAAKQAGIPIPAEPEAEAIFAAVDRLTADGTDREAHERAIGLASIGVTLPCGDKTEVVQRLLALPLPARRKLRLLIGWVLAGERVNADIVIEGIRAYLDDARQQTWMLDHNNRWELNLWLGLLPFADRPEATVTGVEMVLEADHHP